MSDRPTLQDLIEVRRQFKLPSEALVEKDWFVVRALMAIAAADKGPFQLVFQGGTALSRAQSRAQALASVSLRVRDAQVASDQDRRARGRRCRAHSHLAA
ncbi:MAG: hypothetical protein WCA81_05605, partial [Rhizomicrobium sp.]